MKKRIVVITPLVMDQKQNQKDIDEVMKPLDRKDIEVVNVVIETGPVSVESELDEALSVPDTVFKAIAAEKAGAHAIVIECMGDPGLNACREMLKIPVVGPGDTSIHIAALLGQKFSVVTILDSVIPMFMNKAKLNGVIDKLASVRTVGIPVLEIEKDPKKCYQALCEQSLLAVKNDKASVIILGCTGFMGAADAIRKFLKEKLGTNIPVIDPLPSTILFAASLVEAGLSHSKKTYHTPAPKKMIGFPVKLQSKL